MTVASQSFPYEQEVTYFIYRVAASFQTHTIIGLPDLGIHDLRRSYAEVSPMNGDDVKTAQENLGHHTAALILDVYGHATEQMRQAGADRMNTFCRGFSGVYRVNRRAKHNARRKKNLRARMTLRFHCGRGDRI